jgi:hypothetical protein
MEPAHAHMQVESSVSARRSSTLTAVEPGDQGATVLGTHGAGVSTPIAALVAAATAGLAIERHIPKGPMFVIGTKSITVAMDCSSAWVSCVGSTTSFTGAAP